MTKFTGLGNTEKGWDTLGVYVMIPLTYPFSLFLLNLLCFILFTSLGFFLPFQNLPVSYW